ncbi:MAG: hypothetical protein M4579_001701 [Chaenotheca gracillima]|nr:MAG: hypothetical protein M4579_001701 [Chaenotheca gracillima]
MESNQLDRYMDWYAKTWIDKDQQRLPDAILDFFPVERTPQRDTTEVPQGTEDQQIQDVRNVMASSRSRTARQFGKLGSEYKRYRKSADLIPQAQAFFTAAAEVIAIKQETLVRAVFKTETKLDAVAREAKKRG